MSRIVKIAVPVVLVFILVLFYVLNTLMAQVTTKREEGSELLLYGNEVLHTNDKLVKQIRHYVVSKDSRSLQEYNAIIDNTDLIDGNLERMIDIGLSDNEMRKMDRLGTLLDMMANVEDKALDAIGNDDYDLAVSFVFGDEYTSVDLEIAETIKALMAEITERINVESAELTAGGRNGLIGIGVSFIITMAAFTWFTSWFVKKSYWYEDILNHIPLPLSVTDMNLKCTFINKPTEDMLGIKLKDVRGMHCGDIWKAGICGTRRCGIECLKRGEPSSEFEAGEFSFKVDASYLHDKRQHQIGHIEVVQNLTEMKQKQKEEAELVEGIREVSASFVKGSKQIADSANNLAQGANEQTATIDRLTDSINDIRQQTSNSASIAREAANLSETIKSNAEKGNVQMDNMMQAVKEINSAGGQIEKVIKVIEDIAFQTNILALNAAVEAARAGTAGKGFAVVAEEVRNLASKSAEAANNSGVLISDTVEKAHLGLTIATETAESLKEIVDGINKSAQLVEEIAQNTDNQAAATGHLSEGINQVANVVSQNSAAAEQSAAASQQLSGQAAYLEQLVGGGGKPEVFLLGE